jgi:hypothetical protein
MVENVSTAVFILSVVVCCAVVVYQSLKGGKRNE